MTFYQSAEIIALLKNHGAEDCGSVPPQQNQVPQIKPHSPPNVRTLENSFWHSSFGAKTQLESNERKKKVSV